MDKELIRQGRNLSVLIAGPLRTKHIHKSIITRPTIALVGRGEGNYDRTDGRTASNILAAAAARARAQHACSNLGEIWALHFHRSGRSTGRQSHDFSGQIYRRHRTPESVKCDRLHRHRARAQAYTLSFLLRETTQEIFQEGKNTKDQDGREGKLAECPSSVRPRGTASN